MKKILKILLIIILAVIIIVAGVCAFLTFTEFKPEATEEITIDGIAEKTLSDGETLTLITWNLGYGGQSADMDLYSEGGEGSSAPTTSMVNKNLECMRQIMKKQNCDILLLQEVDQKASRSKNVDEVTFLKSTFPGLSSYGQTYDCKFIPIPVKSPLGPVDSGLLTINKFNVYASSRDALVNGYTWPMKLFEPKNCLLIQRVSLGAPATENADQAKEPAGPELVIVNLQFDEKDNGQIKIEQAKALATFMKDEYVKGNYVIAGGTFNQTFPGADETKYPIRNTTYFSPGILEETLFGEGWGFGYDDRTPTARLMDKPYNEFDPYTQCYVIDGFITSPNVKIKGVFTIDTGFKYSSHQPVKLRVTLGNQTSPVMALDANGNPVDASAAAIQGNNPAAAAQGNNTGNTGNYQIGDGILATDGETLYGTN